MLHIVYILYMFYTLYMSYTSILINQPIFPCFFPFFNQELQLREATAIVATKGNASLSHSYNLILFIHLPFFSE